MLKTELKVIFSLMSLLGFIHSMLPTASYFDIFILLVGIIGLTICTLLPKL